MEHPWEHDIIPISSSLHTVWFLFYTIVKDLQSLAYYKERGHWGIGGITKTKWAETQFDKRHSKGIMDLATV